MFRSSSRQNKIDNIFNEYNKYIYKLLIRNTQPQPQPIIAVRVVLQVAVVHAGHLRTVV